MHFRKKKLMHLKMHIYIYMYRLLGDAVLRSNLAHERINGVRRRRSQLLSLASLGCPTPCRASQARALSLHWSQRLGTHYDYVRATRRVCCVAVAVQQLHELGEAHGSDDQVLRQVQCRHECREALHARVLLEQGVHVHVELIRTQLEDGRLRDLQEIVLRARRHQVRRSHGAVAVRVVRVHVPHLRRDLVVRDPQ